MRTKDLNKIDKIFNASISLIKKEGIAGLSISKLAKKAGIATGTLYIYFENKEDLINKLYRKLRDDSNSRFLEGVSKSDDHKSNLKKLWINYLKHRISYHDESIFMEQYYRSPYISKDTLQLAQSLKEPVLGLIQKAKDSDIVRNDIDNEMLFLLMLGFIRELADEHVTKAYVLDDEKIEKAFELNWKSIKK